ncbi:MMPL family transporter [Blastococcus sp. TF02A-26]|uniref:MMPL family transporter n=1 Tax=Blastococcus sp. TF02A-26 TaxID=2250577 RepID=UPI000DE9A078|nr:MMPL family transporter [Blastococcus sp. TF02A-26]RBY81825.1 MMPL family transporter [Blastococcus sp. TF02A-26]
MLLPRLAAWSAAHRRLVLALWAAVLVGGVLCAPALFERLDGDVGSIDGSESDRASELLWEAAPGGETIAAVLDGRPAADLREPVSRLAGELSALPGVAAVATPWSGGGESLVATDGQAVAVAVTFEPTLEGWAAVDDAAALLRDADAPRVVVGGGPLQDDEMDDQAASDLARAEMISMPVALLLMVVLFGGVLAAGIPVLVALAGVGATLGALLLATAVADVSVYAVNVVTMLGLGLAVDYGLLLVSRFREEKAAGGDALYRTFATAGRTVTFSGLTVAASLSGLLVFPDDFLRSMGLAGLAVVLLDLVAALTLVPALLAVWGRRIGPARVGGGHRFAGIARRVRRRPVLVVVVVGGVLALAATPFLGARFADPDARSLPSGSASRELASLAESRFVDAGDVDPVTVVVPGGLTSAEAAAYADRLGALSGVRSVSVRAEVPGLTVLDVVPSGDSQGPVAMRLVDDVRALPAPAPVLVTGDAAQLADYQQALVDRLPWMVLVIAGATTVLLFLFTGSLVVPLKALALGVLSLGASFGALVWVFQDGHLGSLIGTEALGSLSITTPVIVLAIAFGLSMDYEVFLLGRIAEEHRRTGDTDLAVERGLQQTGRIVTAAALLIVVVFAGFVAGGFSPIKQIGLGLALAVVVDATLVRMLLLPAVMTLMGRANWWAPRPLRRLHARLRLTEEAPAVPVPSERVPVPA